MSNSYNQETRKILDDFLETLQAKGEVDPDFLAQLCQMAQTGNLGSPTHIRHAINLLKDKVDEL